MSLHPHIITPVPEETARVARAAFPKGHPYLTFRDVLGTIFQDEDFLALFPAWGEQGDAGGNCKTPVEWPALFTCHSNPEKPPYACQTATRHV